MSRPQPTITAIDQLPLICGIEHICSVYGWSPTAVRAKLRAGTLPVIPFAMYPMRWKRADIEAQVARGGRSIPLRQVAGRRF